MGIASDGVAPDCEGTSWGASVRDGTVWGTSIKLGVDPVGAVNLSGAVVVGVVPNGSGTAEAGVVAAGAGFVERFSRVLGDVVGGGVVGLLGVVVVGTCAKAVVALMMSNESNKVFITSEK